MGVNSKRKVVHDFFWSKNIRKRKSILHAIIEANKVIFKASYIYTIYALKSRVHVDIIWSENYLKNIKEKKKNSSV